jgi:DNA-binding Xre family transcriptional regulator
MAFADGQKNAKAMKERPRRSAGMRGDPRNDAPEHRPISSTPPKLHRQAPQPERVSTSRYAKPKILMGEVTAPIPKFAASRGGVGVEIGKQRDAFRAFMIARRLRPSEWARAAGVPSGEILAFLTGKVRTIAPATLEKLARAAKCAPQDFFKQ